MIFIAISLSLFFRLIRLKKEYVSRIKNNIFNTYKTHSNPTIIINNENIIEYTNDKFKELYNIDLTGKKITDIITEFDLKHLPNNTIQLIDGTHFHTTIISLDILKDKLYGLILEPLDKNATYDKYHLLINNSTDAYYFFNSEAKLILWNKGAELITGYKSEELFGQFYWDILEKLDYDNIKKHGSKDHFKILFKQAIEKGDIYELDKLTEKTIIDKHGNLKVIQERCFILPLNGTKYFCCTFRDFTDRKKLEQTLFESEKKLRQMLDNLPIAVFEATLDGNLTYLNSKGFELLDTNLEQFKNKINVYNLLDEQSKQILIKKVKENFKTQNNSYFLLKLIKPNRQKSQLIVAINIFNEQNNLKILGFADEIDKMSRFIGVQNESIDYTFIFNTLPYFISFAKLKEQSFVEVNKTLVNYLGLNKSEIIGKNSFELKIFENLQIREKFFNALLKNGEVKDFKFYYNHPELGKRLLSADSKIVQYNDSKYILSITKDITDLDEYLTSIEQSEDKYRSIFELSPDIIAILQPNGIVLDINQRVEDFTGIPADKIIGKSMFDFPVIDYHEKNLIKSKFQARISGKKVNPYKITLKHIDGSQKTCVVYGTTIKNLSNDVEKMIIIVSDITELDKAQKEIKTNQLLIENITNTLPISFFIVKYKDWEILWHNRSLLELLGYNPLQISNFSLLKLPEIIHPDDQQLLMDLYERKIDLSEGYEFELRFKNSNDEWRWIYSKILPFKTSKYGTLEELLGISYDITKQKENEEYLKYSEKQLRELNATKDRFFTIISHDLRNPISSFLGLSELLYTSNDLTPQEIRAYGKSINDSANKIYQLLENLLQWAKIQTHQYSFEPIQINLKELIDEIKLIFNLHLINKNITIQNNINDNVIIYFDKNITSTILRNLISNAIKYSYPKSDIIIDCKIIENLAEISVQDFGIGMPEHIKNNLFNIDKIQSFEGTACEKGSGIGLLIIKDFLQSQNCKWDIITKQGEGTTFKFTLPLYNSKN